MALLLAHPPAQQVDVDATPTDHGVAPRALRVCAASRKALECASSRMAHVTLACWLAASACGPAVGASDAGDIPATDGASASCSPGAKRCVGHTYEECTSGTFQSVARCTELEFCDAERGCIARPGPCQVQGDLDGLPDCTERARPVSFEPEIQWAWPGADGNIYSVVTPLVANLTDDNGDQVIDLCDTPDVLVVASAYTNGAPPGYIYVLDGETGALELRFPSPVHAFSTPAIGDIDGDGIPEVVTLQADSTLIAFEHDGTVKWTSTVAYSSSTFAEAVAMADVDNDGDVEILVGLLLFDHQGNLLVTFPSYDVPWLSASTMADMDGDGDLEIVHGGAVYHHTGEALWRTPAVTPGFPHVANFDFDPEPEVLITSWNGISILEHDGAIRYLNRVPASVAGFVFWRPVAIHDYDSDGWAEFAIGSVDEYFMCKSSTAIVWGANVVDESGAAAGTAFDFLGDGSVETIYAGETTLVVLDGTGSVLMQMPRSSRTAIEYPVVVDVDNDGSAEIVITSGEPFSGPTTPTVRVIGDVQDRWIQARRIWNQHTYHVTNVREDGTIPQFEKPSWQHLNTFRANAQIEDGGACDPVVP